MEISCKKRERKTLTLNNGARRWTSRLRIQQDSCKLRMLPPRPTSPRSMHLLRQIFFCSCRLAQLLHSPASSSPRHFRRQRRTSSGEPEPGLSVEFAVSSLLGDDDGGFGLCCSFKRGKERLEVGLNLPNIKMSFCQ